MKKTIRKTLIALAVASIACSSLQAQEVSPIEPSMNEQQLDQVADQIAAAAAPQISDPGLVIDELIEDFKSSPAGVGFTSNPQLFFATAKASVMATPESRDWGVARVMAYKEAMIKAQAEYIRFLGLNISTESVSKMFDDQSKMPSFSEADLRSSNKLGELLDKVVAVAGGKLDQQLQEMGISPEEFRAAPRSKRATLFERSVAQTTTLRGRQELTGIIPVKTFEAYNAEGNHEVAVAVVASPNFRQFVHDIIQSKGDIAPNPDKAMSTSLRDYLRADQAALLNEFGIRRMYDEQGYPVLISFGQSSNPYRGSDYQRRSDNRELSFAVARADSYAHFANLFNSSGMVNEAVTVSAQRSTTGVATAEGLDVTLSEESSTEFMRAINNEIATRGNVSNLAGTRELFRWTQNHPMHGHEINGVVYIWHPQSELQARQLRDFKPAPTAKAQQQQQQPRSSGQTGTSQSRNLMSADDF